MLGWTAALRQACQTRKKKRGKKKSQTWLEFLLKWRKKIPNDDDELGIVSKTFTRELKSDLVWRRAKEEVRGRAISVKESHLPAQRWLHGNESFIAETEWLIKSCERCEYLCVCVFCVFNDQHKGESRHIAASLKPLMWPLPAEPELSRFSAFENGHRWSELTLLMVLKLG